MRRITTAFCVSVAVLHCDTFAAPDCPPLVLESATILDLQAAFDCGSLTSEDLVRIYLARIAAYDQQGPRLNAIITINPNALEIARALDRERGESGPRGPLHGIPVVLKDNYDTFDMPTTGGSTALEHSIPPDDAFQTRRLREAGAIILGKSSLSEFSNGFASLGGRTRNPYGLSRWAGGSSGGSAAAVAAHFAVAGTGTDWGGSIRIPSAWNSLVGLRPTLGLTSGDGIMPWIRTRAVGGPLTRNVTDVAILLDALVGRDPNDPATLAAEGQIPPSYMAFLQVSGLKGARIGVFREFVTDSESPVVSILNSALADLAAAGAEIVDPAPTAEVARLYLEHRGELIQFNTFEYCMNLYLESLGPDAPVQTVQELVALVPRVGNWILGDVPPEELPQYAEVQALEEQLRNEILAVMDANSLDVLIYPTNQQSPQPLNDDYQFFPHTTLAPYIRFPAISVPAGFTAAGLPVGIDFLGRPFSEPTLIRIAYAYEQATGHRAAPASTPVIDCNGNTLPDGLDISRGTSTDCNQDGTLDECDPDCNGNGLPDPCEVLDGLSPDCNGNLQPDGCEVALDVLQARGECPYFASVNIGAFGLGSGGSVRSEDGCLAVAGAPGNLSVTRDAFHYAHQRVPGDFRLTARIDDWQVDLLSSKLGLMVRESLEPNARHGSVVLERRPTGYRHRFLRRENAGGATTSERYETYEQPAVWLRIERQGNTISGQLSVDGTNWSAADTVALADLDDEVHVGVASSYLTSQFTNEPSLATVCDLTIAPLTRGPAFLRGDCNDNGQVDISDGQCILDWRFSGAPAPGCLAATNTNGDGSTNIADAIYLFSSLFLGGPPPVAPFPECGPLTEADAQLGCATPPENCR